MRSASRLVFRLAFVASVCFALVGSCATAFGQRERVVHRFTSVPDGSQTFAYLIPDNAGNLYGTTSQGGTANAGTVFELTPDGEDGWAETVLYSFQTSSDGNFPYGAVVFDGAGNLYGTTMYGGSTGYGTVYELTPAAGGGWTETVIHNFGDTGDGQYPQGALAIDAAGNLYGTTFAGGAHMKCDSSGDSCGTVFEISPSGSGWTESVLYSFGAHGDGHFPISAVTLDSSGNLYGTTMAGGRNKLGTVWQLSPSSRGWQETILHHFSNKGDGASPESDITLDDKGNLYGTTQSTVFQLAQRDETWELHTLHTFRGHSDGLIPSRRVVVGAFGNVYGSTEGGGSADCGGSGCGVIFRLSPESGHVWIENILRRLDGGADGVNAYPGLTMTPTGNLLGTTLYGGDNTSCSEGCGIVYELEGRSSGLRSK